MKTRDNFTSRCKSETNISLGWCKSISLLDLGPEADTSHSKEAGLVIYLAFLAKVPNLYCMILTAFMKYWPDTVVRFKSGTQDKFI